MGRERGWRRRVSEEEGVNEKGESEGGRKGKLESKRKRSGKKSRISEEDIVS